MYDPTIYYERQYFYCILTVQAFSKKYIKKTEKKLINTQNLLQL